MPFMEQCLFSRAGTSRRKVAELVVDPLLKVCSFLAVCLYECGDTVSLPLLFIGSVLGLLGTDIAAPSRAFCLRTLWLVCTCAGETLSRG